MQMQHQYLLGWRFLKEHFNHLIRNCCPWNAEYRCSSWLHWIICEFQLHKHGYSEFKRFIVDAGCSYWERLRYFKVVSSLTQESLIPIHASDLEVIVDVVAVLGTK